MNKKIIMLATTIMLVTSSYAKTEECKSGFKGFTAGVTVGYQAQQAKTTVTTNPSVANISNGVYFLSQQLQRGLLLGDPIRGIWVEVPPEALPTLSESSKTMTANNSKWGMTYGLKFGYGHTHGKFHIGGQLFGEMNTGTIMLHKGNPGSYTTYPIGSQTVAYATPQPVGITQPAVPTSMQKVGVKLTLKTQYTYGAGIKIGIDQGDWLLYVPFNLSISRYMTNCTQDPISAAYGTVANPTPVVFLKDYTPTDSQQGAGTATVAEYTVNKMTATGNATGGTSTSPSYKKGKTKIGCSFGLGMAIKLTEKVSLDLCYTYSPNSNITVNKPSYPTPVLYDVAQFGTTSKYKISAQKVTLGVVWHV